MGPAHADGGRLHALNYWDGSNEGRADGVGWQWELPGENTGCEFVVGFIAMVSISYLRQGCDIGRAKASGVEGRGRTRTPGCREARDEVQQVGANQVAG